jgi:predicted Fe-Mo cluster-binding NifX family protein
MKQKLLIPLMGDNIAPRFDLSTEAVIITSFDHDGIGNEEKMLVFSEGSAEKLCHLILTEGAKVVICGGIEEEYYRYLTWKKIKVFDSVIGSWKLATEHFRKGILKPGAILDQKQLNKIIT